MNNSGKIVCFLLLIPFFLVAGHDIYANFLTTDEEISKAMALQIDLQSYQSSELGYLLVTYAPGFYAELQKAADPAVWFAWIDPTLRLYSFVVALAPFALFCVWLLIGGVLGLWPFSGTSVRKPDEEAASMDNRYEARNIRRSFKFNRR